MGRSLERTIDAGTTISEWPFVASSAPTAGTEIPDISILDYGTVAGGSNGEAKAITVNFPADFDDSVFDVRIWLLNKPNFSGHVYKLLTGAAATFPLLITDDIGGIDFPCSREAAAFLGAALYDTVNNRIREIITQAQPNAGAAVKNSALLPLSNPLIKVEASRQDYATSSLEPREVALDVTRGHLLNLSDVNLYTIDSAGCEQWIASILDDQLSINDTVELVNWEKGKPKATFHQAKIMTQGIITAKIDEIAPDMWARAIQTQVITNAAQKSLDIVNRTKQEGIREAQYIVRWRSHGGFVQEFILPRGVVKFTGELTPGADEFAGREIEITGLAELCKSGVSIYRISQVPIEYTCDLPVCYDITA